MHDVGTGIVNSADARDIAWRVLIHPIFSVLSLRLGPALALPRPPGTI